MPQKQRKTKTELLAKQVANRQLPLFQHTCSVRYCFMMPDVAGLCRYHSALRDTRKK